MAAEEVAADNAELTPTEENVYANAYDLYQQYYQQQPVQQYIPDTQVHPHHHQVKKQGFSDYSSYDSAIKEIDTEALVSNRALPFA